MNTSAMLSLDLCYNGLPFYGYSLGGKVSIFSKTGASAVKSVGVLESGKVNKITGVIIG